MSINILTLLIMKVKNDPLTSSSIILSPSIFEVDRSLVPLFFPVKPPYMYRQLPFLAMVFDSRLL